MLKWVFGADTSPFRRSLNQMRGDVQKFSGSVKGYLAGMFGAAAIFAGFQRLFAEMDRVQKLAIRFGESAESIQRVGLASDLAGAPLETLAKGIQLATKNANEAINGNEAFAESFEKLGIKASEFINLSMESKILALAGAYDQGASSSETLANMLEVLGKSGGELIPLLAQGQEELQRQFENTSTVSQSTIDSIAKFNDAITSLKQKAQVLGAGMVDAFRMSGAALEWLLNLMTGSKDKADEQFEKRMDAIAYGDSSGKSAEAAAEAAIQNAKEQAEIEKSRKKLTEDIAKLEEESRIRSLSLAEKILDAEKRRAELAAEAIFGDDETKSLEARKEQLQIEKTLAGLRKDQSDEDRKSSDAKQKAIEKNAAEMVKLAEESVLLDRENKLAGMTDSKKRDFLKGERDQANRDAKSANDRGDYKGGLEFSNKAKQLTGEIDDITRGLNDDLQKKLADAQKAVPTIATSSLADIGGGGGARLMDNDQQRRMVDLLAQIAANTAGGSEGSKPPEPI